MKKETTIYDKKQLSKRDQDFIDADNAQQDLKKDIEEQADQYANSTLVNDIDKGLIKTAYVRGYKKALEERPSDERINKYARHQFNRGSLVLSLVTFEEWATFPNPKENS